MKVKNWEVILVFMLVGILFFVLYFISSIGLIPPMAEFVQDAILKVGNFLRLGKIVNFISELFNITI